MSKYYTLITILFSFFISAQDYSVTAIPEELKKNAYAVVRCMRKKTKITIRNRKYK